MKIGVLVLFFAFTRAAVKSQLIPVFPGTIEYSMHSGITQVRAVYHYLTCLPGSASHSYRRLLSQYSPSMIG